MTAKELGEQPSGYTVHSEEHTDSNGKTHWSNDDGIVSKGLTKREWLAGLIIQGAIANPNNQANFDVLAAHAIGQADALLAELAKEVK